MIASTETILARAIEAEYGRSVSISRAAGENENFLVSTRDGARFIAKVAGSGTDRGRIELEHLTVEAVASAGLDIALPRLIPTRHGEVIFSFVDGAGNRRCARLLEFVPGHAWGMSVPAPTSRLQHLGQMIAHVALALRGIDTPAARVSHPWDLERVQPHWANLSVVGDRERRRTLAVAFQRWAAAKQDLATVPRGLIHGDLNDDNILINDGAICGLLDFGDALVNPLVCDLAIALAYVLLDQPDPWGAGAQIIVGYHEVRPLSATEIELLYPLLTARLAVSLVISAARQRVDPNRVGWFVTEERGWSFLERFGNGDPVEIADRLAGETGIRPYPDRGAPAVDLRARRSRHTSTALSLSYDEPVKFIRGRGAYLIDERGHSFLDLYNNVCHVGHCHPHVVQAGQRQMAHLNTNTRYLTDAHVEYVERLASLLPPPLGTVFLLNSGSEANELALRLARVHTGHNDILVVDNAYHGHTQALIDVSPYKFAGRGGRGKPPWVHILPLPDTGDGRCCDHAKETSIPVGDEIGQMISQAERPIAAFIAETLLSCGGQVIPPPGYFEAAFRNVRGAGGVCILDEVQVGFGRVGSHFWAFQRYDVVPDIVVLGKPIGNGHPMAVVACTRAIAASFEATGMEFFSTFGGNPVSCAIGLAVLDVIEQEGLQEHARVTGSHLLTTLGQLAARHPSIGDVRGVGLFAGVEIVDTEGAPSGTRARQIVQALRQQRILVGTDGPHDNVIKIKPPLVVGTQDVDRFALELDHALGGCEAA